jgi:hypothetical protein
LVAIVFLQQIADYVFFATAEKAALQKKRNRIAGRFTKQRCDKIVRNMQKNLVERRNFFVLRISLRFTIILRH